MTISVTANGLEPQLYLETTREVNGMICSKSPAVHRFHQALSVALLILPVVITGCRKEQPSAESLTSPEAPASAAPPAAPSPAPSGVFVHQDRATSGGYEVAYYSILRFGKDGQVCSVNVSTDLDDEVLSQYSKSCDAHEKNRDYGRYTFVNGTITFSLGESDYSGVFNKDRLILTTLYRPTQKTSTDEYRHHDVGYDNQEQRRIPSGSGNP